MDKAFELLHEKNLQMLAKNVNSLEDQETLDRNAGHRDSRLRQFSHRDGPLLGIELEPGSLHSS